MSLINSFNTSENFWILNPQFQNIQPFKKLHHSDKSRDKGKSSKIMWFIAQIADTSGSNTFRNLNFEERVALLALDFMEDNNYFDNNKELLDPLVKMYKNLHMTPALKALEEWNEKITQRAKFIKDTPYSVDIFELGIEGKPIKVPGTAKILDDMMKATKSIYDHYHLILKSLTEEDEEHQVKGGQKLSLSDLGEI